MNKMPKIIIGAILFFTVLGGYRASADTAGSGANNFSYLFHLYFDNGTLVVDRDAHFQYDVVAAPYTAPVIATGFPYHGEVITFAGSVAATFTFDPRGGNANFTAGKISVSAPYVADAARAVFYNSQNQSLLTISLDASSYCNDDGICNADRGEDYASCPTDCKAATLPTPSTTPVAAATAGSTGALTLAILYLLIGLVLLGGLWWFFKRRKPNQPTPPPPSLPTPPAPPTP